MRNIIMSRLTFFYFTFFFFISSTFLFSQSIPADVSALSDAQIKQYWEQTQQLGYTMDQIKAVAELKGVSDVQISLLEERINGLGQNGPKTLTQVNDPLAVNNNVPFGFVGNAVNDEVKKNVIFGIDFFNNPNLSFAPNLNIATPESYQLGPGDEIAINVWGAAEGSYNLKVNKEGVLRLPNVGPVFVNGMEMKTAQNVIKSKLKRIYAGISASNTSPYKVFVEISLSAVRSIQVDLIGEVKVPGTYTLNSLSSVLNALYAAGGPTENGTFRAIKLIRKGVEPVYFDLYDYLLNGSQVGNVNLRDNDLIIVSPYLSRVTIKGAVKRPGQFELKPNELFSDLLKFVSGFTAKAYKDQVSLRRIVGDRVAIKEVAYDIILNESLESGDIIDVSSIIERVENSVTINGPLYRPGTYEFLEGLTLIQLIDKASGITEETYLDRGLIYRGDNYSTRTSIPFSVKDVLDGAISIALENNDRVELFNKDFLNFNENISISGGVRQAGNFPYYKNLTIEDLILTAGGLSESANPLVINIFRKVKDDDFDTLTKSFEISLSDDVLDFSNTSDFALKPGDRVSVRLLKGINNYVNVIVEGEVNYPGNYAMSLRNERISDVIQRAGGLSEYAFLNGATLVRVNPFYKEVSKGIIQENVGGNEYVNLDLNNKREFKVGIDLKDILKNPKNIKQNIIVKNGDKIIIPSIKSTVKTEGEVLIPSLIREEKNLNFRDYINKSGGFNSEALRRKSYVIHPNGDIVATKSFLFFKNYPKVLPGSIIVVPKKVKNPDAITTQEVLGLSSGFATLALLIDRFFSN